jgi:hypothetical protein
VAACAIALGAFAAGCAPRIGVVTIPSSAGTPSDEARDTVRAARRACHAVNSLTAEVGVAGRVGRERIRGRLLVGFETGGRARIEALAPFGQPVFILVADGDRGMLLLPRDRRVVRDVEAGELLAAVAGIHADGDHLKSLLTGCLVPGERVAEGRRHEEGWVSAELAGDGAAVFVRDVQSMPRVLSGRVRSASRPGELLVGYDAYAADGLPRTVRLQGASRESPLALELTLRQVGLNEVLGPDAFEIHVPPDAVPMTLEQLQASSPLSQAR